MNSRRTNKRKDDRVNAFRNDRFFLLLASSSSHVVFIIHVIASIYVWFEFQNPQDSTQGTVVPLILRGFRKTMTMAFTVTASDISHDATLLLSTRGIPIKRGLFGVAKANVVQSIGERIKTKFTASKSIWQK